MVCVLQLVKAHIIIVCQANCTSSLGLQFSPVVNQTIKKQSEKLVAAGFTLHFLLSLPSTSRPGPLPPPRVYVHCSVRNFSRSFGLKCSSQSFKVEAEAVYKVKLVGPDGEKKFEAAGNCYVLDAKQSCNLYKTHNCSNKLDGKVISDIRFIVEPS
ncbi:unnamed protein product [Linum trigynum]|uniref:Uncharacterized protein n=1 Tax=Linum trigynum TaxID=586398 RepID=A0AAV2D584_9ROSI